MSYSVLPKGDSPVPLCLCSGMWERSSVVIAVDGIER